MANMFRGNKHVRTGILAFFRDNLTAYLDEAESQWGTKVIRPNRMEAFEAVSFNHEDKCIIAVSIGSSRSFTTTDVDEFGGRSYRPDYDVQIYTWCLGGYDENDDATYTGRVEALASRDDISAIIRAMLLDQPALGQPDAFELIESSLEEEYSLGEATPNASGRYIAGSVHNFTLRVDESLVRKTNEYANTIIVDADKLLEDHEEGNQL